MRKTLIILAAVAVALAIFGCQKKAEEPTAETAAPAMTVDEAKGRLQAVLEEVETLRSTAEEPTTELVQGFKDNAAKLETLHAELKEIAVPEAEAEAYAEVAAKVEAGIEAVNGMARLTEIAMDEETEATQEEVMSISDNARAKFVEACEYAAPEIAAKMKLPAEEPT
jgi:hypothetical protein